MRAILLSLLCLNAATAAGTAEVRALQEQVSAAYGGAEPLSGVAGIRARGRTLDVATGLGGRLDVVVDMRGSLRTETRYPDGAEVRILAGPLAWSGDDLQQEPASPEVADALRFLFLSLSAPFLLAREAPDSLEMAGASPEGWTRIRRRSAPGPATTYDIDPSTGLVRRVAREGPDGETNLVAECHDFRKVAGLVVPFRTTTASGGTVVKETVFHRVRFDEELEAADFLPAGAGAGI